MKIKNVEKFVPINSMVDLICMILNDYTECKIKANKYRHANVNSFTIVFFPVFNVVLFIYDFDFEI